MVPIAYHGYTNCKVTQVIPRPYTEVIPRLPGRQMKVTLRTYQGHSKVTNVTPRSTKVTSRTYDSNTKVRQLQWSTYQGCSKILPWLHQGQTKVIWLYQGHIKMINVASRSHQVTPRHTRSYILSHIKGTALSHQGHTKVTH